MLQALIHRGSVKAEQVPAPIVGKGRVLIRVVNSCISAGTEMASVSSTGKSPVQIMREQPEKIRKVFDLIRSEGLRKITDQYKFIKESGQPTGYSVSGIIIGLGEGVTEFKIGEHVAAAGGGYAYHAEFVEVPVNLVVVIPPGLGFPEASTVAIGAIALHGVRRTRLEIGEFCVVMGVGILGLIAVQMLVKSGVRVVAVDIDESRLTLASALGSHFAVNPAKEDPVKAIENITEEHGADAVLFAASTSDNKPLSQAFQMCRRKGKVVLVGVSGMELNRKDIYPGELDLNISTSYGPGRYDKVYEENGIDYPYAYVRWTEGRNFTEYLRLLASKQVVIEPLIHKIFPVEEAGMAFDSLKDTNKKPLIVLLDYGLPSDFTSLTLTRKVILNSNTSVNKDTINVGLLGVGNFAQSVHLPNLKKLDSKFNIYALASHSGVKAKNAGSFYNAQYVTTEYDQIINDSNIDLVMICTRHGNHASLALQALKAGKHVFVEKPLATNFTDLRLLEEYIEANPDKLPLLMVGYNRRFSPYAMEIRKHTDQRIGPLFIHYRMNAGFQPHDHWTHQDGGRIIGEACHIVDLMNSLTNCRIISCHAEGIDSDKGKFTGSDNKSILLKYEDGSLAAIEYLSLGNRSMAKEYMEIHFDEKSIVLTDYKELDGYGIKINNLRSKTSLKGHMEELDILYAFLKGKIKEWPVEWWQLLQTTKTLLTID